MVGRGGARKGENERPWRSNGHGGARRGLVGSVRVTARAEIQVWSWLERAAMQKKSMGVGMGAKLSISLCCPPHPPAGQHATLIQQPADCCCAGSCGKVDCGGAAVCIGGSNG